MGEKREATFRDFINYNSRPLLTQANLAKDLVAIIPVVEKRNHTTGVESLEKSTDRNIEKTK